jgi:hypothetical protein
MKSVRKWKNRVLVSLTAVLVLSTGFMQTGSAFAIETMVAVAGKLNGYEAADIVAFKANTGTLTITADGLPSNLSLSIGLYEPETGEVVGHYQLAQGESKPIEIKHNGSYELFFSYADQPQSDTLPAVSLKLTGADVTVTDSIIPDIEVTGVTSYQSVKSTLIVSVINNGEPIESLDWYVNGKLVDILKPQAGQKQFTIGLNPAQITDLKDGLGHLDIVAKRSQSANRSIYSFPIRVDLTDAFGDVPKSHWAHDSIEAMYDYGIVHGIAEGQFAPEQDVTREQFAVMLAGALDLDVRIAGAQIFADVPNDDWSTASINALANHGFAAGEMVNGIRKFQPYRTVSRLEAMVMISKAIDSSINKSQGGETSFTDWAQVPEWGKAHAQYMAQIGWVHGYKDGRIDPFRTLNRAEAAKLLGHFLNVA